MEKWPSTVPSGECVDALPAGRRTAVRISPARRQHLTPSAGCPL